MVTLTRDAVGRIARALITLNGETTTLDVKEAARKLGFWATQKEVREYMLDITSENGDILYVTNSVDNFRTYVFTVPFPVVDKLVGVGHDLQVKFGKIFTSVPLVRCTKCGCSETAIKSFGWNCTTKIDGDAIITTTTSDKITWVTTNDAVVITSQSPISNVEFGDYWVGDMWNHNGRRYNQVSRGVAKNMWVKEMRRLGFCYSFFDARARKVY
jgi:hypothetical protein